MTMLSPSDAYKAALGLDQSGYRTFGHGTGPSEPIYSLSDAAIGHANALALREDLRVDLQQLDLLCSDIAHFRKKHAGSEMQRLRQRSHSINSWVQGFQDFFAKKCGDIMKTADTIRNDQETLAREAKEQYTAAQKSVEALEKQVAGLQEKLAEEMQEYEVEIEKINQRKERLERQIRSLESKRESDRQLAKDALLQGEADIEELDKIRLQLEQRMIEKDRETDIHEKRCRERYNMLIEENETQREILAKETIQGMWEQRFLSLVDKYLKKEDLPPNPTRTSHRAPMWDEIENLDTDLKELERRGEENPLSVALKHIVETEVGTAKSNMLHMKKLYDQTISVRNLNGAIASTFSQIESMHPEIFDKDYVPSITRLAQENEKELENQSRPGLVDVTKLSPRQQDLLPSARYDQEIPKTRYVRATSVKNTSKKFEFDPRDMNFLANPQERFSRGLMVDFPVDDMLGDIDLTKLPRPEGNWVEFRPQVEEKPGGGSDHKDAWATFGDAWLDA